MLFRASDELFPKRAPQFRSSCRLRPQPPGRDPDPKPETPEPCPSGALCLLRSVEKVYCVYFYYYDSYYYVIAIFPYFYYYYYYIRSFKNTLNHPELLCDRTPWCVEATSALDTQSEAIVQKAKCESLSRLSDFRSEGRTTLKTPNPQNPLGPEDGRNYTAPRSPCTNIVGTFKISGPQQMYVIL